MCSNHRLGLGKLTYIFCAVVGVLSWNASQIRADVYRAQTSGFGAVSGSGSVVSDADAIDDDAWRHVSESGTTFAQCDVTVPAGTYVLAVRVKEVTAGASGRLRVDWSGGNWLSGFFDFGETFETNADRWHVLNGEVYGFREIATGQWDAVAGVRVAVLASTADIDEVWIYTSDEGYATRAEAEATLGGGPPTPANIYRIKSDQFTALIGSGGVSVDSFATEDDVYHVTVGGDTEAGISAPAAIAAGQYNLAVRWKSYGTPTFDGRIRLVWAENTHTTAYVTTPDSYAELTNLRWFNFDGEVYSFYQFGSVNVGDVTSVEAMCRMGLGDSFTVDEIILFKAGEGYETEAEAMGAATGEWSSINAQLDYSTIPAMLVVQGVRGGTNVVHSWGYSSSGVWQSVGELDTQSQIQALQIVLLGGPSAGQTVAPTWATIGPIRTQNPPVMMLSEWVWAQVAYLRTSDPATYAAFDGSTISQAMASPPDIVVRGDPMFGPAWRAYLGIKAGVQ